MSSGVITPQQFHSNLPDHRDRKDSNLTYLNPSTTAHTTNVFTIEMACYTHYLGHLFIYHVAFWPNTFEEIELKGILFLKGQISTGYHL